MAAAVGPLSPSVPTSWEPLLTVFSYVVVLLQLYRQLLLNTLNCSGITGDEEMGIVQVLNDKLGARLVVDVDQNLLHGRVTEAHTNVSVVETGWLREDSDHVIKTPGARR